MTNKKRISLALALLLGLSSFTACQKSEEKPAEEKAQEEKADEADKKEAKPENEGKKEGEKTDGKFEATGPGYGGDIKVAVDLKDGKIENIEILDNLESAGVGKVAMPIVADRIKKGQSVNVDSVTGATASSKGLMLAVTNALKEAKIDDKFKEEYKEDREYPSELDADVVILGGGGAGLAAAVEAVEKGSSVIVVEKNGYVGGNTILSGGIYNAPDPENQKAQGIEDSNELFFKQTFEAGDEVANPELVKTMTDNAYDGLVWLKKLGTKFEDKIIQGAGSLYPRTHQAVKPNGTGLIEAYEENLNGKENYKLLTETTAKKILMDGDKVSGAVCENHDGSELKIKANKAVIISTGGFAKNAEMVVEYKDAEKWPNLDENTISTNLDSIRGDGITMGKEVGADLVDMGLMQFLYLGIPKKGQITGLVDLGAEKTLFVNKEGKRFVREDGRRDVICKAIFDQTDGEMWLIHSSDALDFDTEKTIEGKDFKTVLENGEFGWVKGDTLEELAEKMNVPYENLKETIDQYNKAVDDKKDEFGRENLTIKFEKGPFVGVPRVPSLHHTMGGLRIDKDCHVLNKDGNVIKGLYAAGEVTGGIHGANRVGGNAIVDTVVFGRIAGQNAADEK